MRVLPSRVSAHGTCSNKFGDPQTSLHKPFLVILPMLFHTNTHPGRQRSSFSTAALGRPSRRTVFIYASNAGYTRGTLRGLLNSDLRKSLAFSYSNYSF